MVRALVGRLSEKNHAELLALLEQLVQRQPDIEPLIELLMELPLATTAQERSRPGKGRERTLDPSTFRANGITAASFIFWRHSNRQSTSAMKICLRSIVKPVCTRNWW